MKHLQGSSLIFGVATTIVMAAQPVWAKTTTQITGVQINATDGGVNVVLKTSNGDRPQIFTTRRGNAVVSDIINTQLRLSEGNSFRQDNPAPGIASVVINQLDANSIRIIVTGTGGAPSGQAAVRKPQEITLGFSNNGAAASTPQGETPAAGTPPTSPQAQAPAPGQPPNVRKPVMVPNPEISIDGKPAPAAGPAQPVTPAPPFLPRAVAPPVGDIAVSNIDVSPSTIDLGTQERVPRLVLRDAPVREVLSLLARAAGLNLAYTTAGATGRPGQPAPPPGVPGAGNEGPTISLDIENEPVQDVFNYVLRLSGLEANRTGRTIFVGPKLPNSTRDNVVRSLRLNQVTVDVALNFLVGLGAESAVSRERLVTSVNAVPVTAPGGAGAQTAITQTQTVTEQRLELQRVDFQDSQPILRGLQALGDARTNSVTLIGNPRQVEFAIAQLTQLDVRRRQVAVNVKVVDVDLSNTDFANTSFSFGIVDSFFGFGATDDPAAGGGIVSLNRRPGDILNPGSGAMPRRFLARLQSQIATGNGKILTDPVLVVQEGQTANVKLTREVIGNIRREISTRQGGTDIETITVEKVGAGLTLNVRVDRIDDNGFVGLSVAPVVTIPYDTITANVGGGGGTAITLLNERSLQSGVIRMRDGQTLVLSGIIQDSDRTEVRKVPILGDIPILGALFRRTSRTNERREVIVLLTPQIMDDSERSSAGYNYTPSPDARQMLERRGLQVPKQ